MFGKPVPVDACSAPLDSDIECVHDWTLDGCPYLSYHFKGEWKGYSKCLLESGELIDWHSFLCLFFATCSDMKLLIREYFKKKRFNSINKKLWNLFCEISDANRGLVAVTSLVEYEISRELNEKEREQVKFFVLEKDYEHENRAWFEDYVNDIFRFIEEINSKR